MSLEPFSQLAMLGVGLGLEIYGHEKSQGGYSQINQGAQSYNTAQVANIQAEQKVEEQRKQAMELQAGRAQVENLRNVQRARSAGLAAATSQGAQFGSGYAGGQAQITSQGAYNSKKTSQDLQIGENVFNLHAQMSADKIAMANANLQMQQGQQTVAEGAGWSSLGGSLMGASGAFGRLASGFGGGGNSGNNFSQQQPGSYGFFG